MTSRSVGAGSAFGADEYLRLSYATFMENLSVSTSEEMIQGKFKGKFSKEQVIRVMSEAVDLAKEKGIRTIGVNAEDASRTDIDYLIKNFSSYSYHIFCH